MIKVLIVEDDEASLLYMEEILSKDYKLQLVSTAEDALESVEQFIPDIILLDVKLSNPDKNGYQICKEIRQNKKFDEIWIIFVTSKDFKEDRLKGYSVGGDDYIVKPFYKDELLSKLKKVSTRIDDYSTVKDSLSSRDGKSGSLLSDDRFTKLLYEVTNEVNKIIYIKAEAPYCRFICNKDPNDQFLIRISIKDIPLFFRNQKLIQVHRSVIVNQELILSLIKKNNHDFDIKLQISASESIMLPIGRTYISAIKKLLAE